jgi:O-succinylbenzoate synthase
LAKKYNINPIISSSFETGVGLTTLANLAACSPNVACGLDTQKYFKYDISKYNFSPKNGEIDLLKLNKSRNQIRFDLLKKVHV